MRFNDGDRVRIKGDYYENEGGLGEGVIVSSFGHEYLISFDNFVRGHNGHGMVPKAEQCRRDSCWFVNKELVVLVTPISPKERVVHKILEMRRKREEMGYVF
jgi:hypothetical protein